MWGDPNVDYEHISHGFCPICIKKKEDLIRRRQRREGFSDCFNRGYENCNEEECAFRFSCLGQAIDKWKETVLYEDER